MKATIDRVELHNDNIVYLLSGKDSEGQDNLYVGMSSDGLRTRPTGHKDKNIPWDYCYFLTVLDPEVINGGMAEFIEYYLAHRVMDSKLYISQTERVSDKKSNPKEKELCKTMVLPYLVQILDILGIHLREQKKVDITQFAQHINRFGTVPVSESNDYSVLKMGGLISDWLENMEMIMKSLYPAIDTVIKTDSKYVAYKKGKKTVIRCYPKKDESRIDVFFYGRPEVYSDSKITLRPENRHDKPLDSMFVIRDNSDLNYFQLFAQKAIDLL